MYAVIVTGGKQYKVSEGDVIFVEKLEVAEGESVTFDNVLAVSVNTEMEDGIVLDEFQSGYKMKDKVIRCSQVLVNKLD